MNLSFQKLTSFHIKIIAMILMVIDHIGALLIPTNTIIYLVIRAIGRLSLPLFAFMLVEGMHYSKKPLRNLSVMLIIGIIIDIIYYLFANSYFGNILTSFFLSGLCIYFLERKNIGLKLCSIFPFAIGILSGFSFFPIRLQYGPYGIILVLLFYLAFKISQSMSKFFPVTLNEGGTQNNQNYIFFYTLLCTLFFVIYSVITAFLEEPLCYILTANDVGFKFQTYSLFAVIFLLCYNGKRGYSSPIFKWGCYLFYPLQFIVIYLIGLLIHLL